MPDRTLRFGSLMGIVSLTLVIACGTPTNRSTTSPPPERCAHYGVFVINNTDLEVDIRQGSTLVGSVSPRSRQELPLPSSERVSWRFSPPGPLNTADTSDVRLYNSDVWMNTHCR